MKNTKMNYISPFIKTVYTTPRVGVCYDPSNVNESFTVNDIGGMDE